MVIPGAGTVIGSAIGGILGSLVLSEALEGLSEVLSGAIYDNRQRQSGQ